MQGKRKPKHLLQYFIGCFFLAMLLIVGTGDSALAQKKKNAQQYPSTRSNKSQVEKGKKKQKKVKFDPNTTKNFKPKSKRERRKIAKMKKKPQYSDPSYFGHKKKPKKRPPGKQKYCKECDMRH